MVHVMDATIEWISSFEAELNCHLIVSSCKVNFHLTVHVMDAMIEWPSSLQHIQEFGISSRTDW